MGSPIQKLIVDYQDLHKFLLENGQVSASVDVNEHYRKILLFSCASYYETRIVEIIKAFVASKSSDSRISEFVNNKAIQRQYHTYFDWKQTNNINTFLGLFGPNFKEEVLTEIKSSENLADQIKAFMIIGSERNKMAHGNFLEYKLDKTFDELAELQEKANLFIEYLERKFQ